MKSFLLALVLGVAALVPRPTLAAAGNSNPNPIRIIFDLHADPRPELTGAFGAMTYSNWVDASNWLLDQTEPRGAKVSFLSVGQFMEWVLARPATGYPLMRRLYASGGQIGTHSHDDSRASPFNWTNLPAHPDSAAITKFWEDHLNLVDEVIRRALGVTDPAAIRAINFVRGSWLPSDDGERLALMALSGYTQHEQGPDEEFFKYFKHYAMNPYRPLGDLFLQHDPAGAVIVAPIGSVLGSTEHMGFAQDNRVPAIQARFLLEVLNWLHDRHVAGTGKIWCKGWGSHCHDMLPGGTSRDFVVPILDWLNEHFVDKPVGGSVCASFSSMGEVGDAYRAWETEHPGETSFSYPATTTDWSLYPYLRPPAEYLAEADYVSNMPPVGTVRWHKVTIDPEGTSPYTGYVAYSTNGVPVTVNLSASLPLPTIVAVDTVTGAATVVPRTAVPVPAKGVILVPAARVSRPDLRVTISVSPNPVMDTSNFTYSVTVTNKGGGAASGIVYSNSTLTGLTFVSATSSQGSCSNTSSGVQCSLGTLQPGGTVMVNVLGIPDFNQLATVFNIPDTQETITVSNVVTVNSTEADAAPIDNSAGVALIVVPLRDFGDAPAPPYPTLLPNGARHKVSALRFGVLLDAEPNGQPVDLDDVIGVADEITDGFGLPAGGFYAGGWTPIVIMVSGPAGYIDMWMDADGFPGWGAADHVMAAVAHPGGGAAVGYMIALPPGAITGMTWARARVGLNPAGLPPNGYGGYGEVVDFQVNITFPPIVAFNGLQHEALGGAQLNVVSNGLQVANLGTTGTDGVRINLGRAEGWRGDVTSFYDWSDIIWSARGTIGGQSNQPLGSLRIERAGSNLTFSADFSGIGASQYVAEYYDQSGVHLSSTPPMSARQSITILGCVCHIEVFADSIYILVCDCDIGILGGGFPGGSPGGILVKLSAVAPTARPEFVSAVEITGTGSLTLGSEALRQFGLWHRFVGGASVGMQDQPTLRVGNLGSSGADGIETIVGGPEYIGELPAGNLLRQRVVQFWCCWDDWFLTSSNSHVRWTATGRVTGSVNEYYDTEMLWFKQEQGTALSASFASLGAAQAQVDVFNGLVHVGSFTLPGLGKLNASTGGVARVVTAITDGTPVWTVKWDTRSAFTPSNGVPLIGDRLRISAVNPTMRVEGLRRLITRGANVESFTVAGFNTATPQRPRLSAPRLLSGGRLEISLPSEPDVTYDLERSASVNGPWTRIGTAMGTDEANTPSFFDIFVGDEAFYRIRVR